MKVCNDHNQSDLPSIVCPRCGLRSYNTNDIRHRYCAVCGYHEDLSNHATSWYWLSFCDGSRPEGSRFLGAVVVRAIDEIDAIAVSHRRKINPGGEVLIHRIPDDYAHRLTEDITYRLLSREQCDEIERKYERGDQG